MRQLRLIKYLKDKYKDMSAREIKRALDMGACSINGKIERLGSRLINLQKDKIKFKAIKTKATDKLTVKKENIIYQDDDLIVYNKEPGHAALATEGHGPNLHEILKQDLKLKFLEPVHRLDKNTSGLIIFAKSKDALTKLNQMFHDKKIKKTYEAIIDGKWKLKNQKGTIKNYLCLAFKKGSMQKWKIAENIDPEQNKNHKYKDALTEYKIIKTYKDYNHIELQPRTGRTHQLRVHMASMGHPIVGDSIYATNFKSKIMARRHLLHAGKLEFEHPITKEKLSLSADMPADMIELLD